MTHDYVFIGNVDNSKKVVITNPFNIDDTSFDTYTIMTERNPTMYTAKRIENTDMFHVVFKESVVYYDLCDNRKAEMIVLPYYLGTDFKKIVKVVGDQFVVKDKLPLTRTAVDDVFEPKDNDILGYIALSHIESLTPRYEGDCNSLIKVYNERAKYLKKI